MTIAEALVECQKRTGMTDVQIAAAIGTGEITVSRWRTGQTEPQFKFYKRLVEIFPDLPKLVGAAA